MKNTLCIMLWATLIACEKPSNDAVPLRAFEVGPFTRPLPDPEPGDWLAEHPEPGQTFKGFLRTTEKHVPTAARKTIYIQPIGAFETWAPTRDEMLSFTHSFFQLPTKVLPPIPIDKKIRSRQHGPWGTQLLTNDILDQLAEQLPSDAFCVLGVTMTDLYPDPEWNFVFGQATFSERVGVFSFARHVPAQPGLRPTPENRKTMLLRSFKILAHEIGHMFGIRHCTAYLCGMNGSNHQGESDRQPLNFCPVCLQKLQNSVGFDVVKRYEGLSLNLDSVGLDEQASFNRRRNQWLSAQSD